MLNGTLDKTIEEQLVEWDNLNELFQRMVVANRKGEDNEHTNIRHKKVQ